MKKEIETKIKEYFEGLNLSFDIFDFIEVDSINEDTNFDSLTDALSETSVFDIEFIYYDDAMEYLAKHDSSLEDSLAIASDYGYTPKRLSSTLLASLLASDNAKDEWYINEESIKEFLSELFNDDDDKV